MSGTLLVVQGLRLYVPNVGSPGLIPGLGIGSCVLKLRFLMPQLRPGAAK